MPVHLDEAPPPEFLETIRRVLQDDEIHLHNRVAMNHVEEGPAGDGGAERLDIGSELVAERRGEPGCIGRLQLHDHVDIPGHARVAVMTRRDRPGDHVRDSRRIEPARHELQDGQLILRRVAHDGVYHPIGHGRPLHHAPRYNLTRSRTRHDADSRHPARPV